MSTESLASEAGGEAVVSLDRAPRARRVEVVEVVGGRRATHQLTQLAIRVGETLRVRRTAPLGGPLLVETRGSTVAVGRGLARKVRVRVLA